MYYLFQYFSSTGWPAYVKIISIVLMILTTIGIAGSIVLENRNPIKALAYILLLVYLPIAGMIVYYYLGRDLKKKKLFTLKGSKDEALYAGFWELQRSRIEQRQIALRLLEGEKQEVSAMLLNTRQSMVTKHNRVQLLINGERKIPVVLEALKAATHHIHIEYYMITNDSVGQAVTDVLLEKLKEGIEVRVIYDDLGSSRIGDIPKRLRAAGAEVYAFSPVLINFYLNANYRDHRKVIVIDGKVGFIGGINLDERYVNNGKHTTYWRDTHLKIEGESMNLLQLQFLLSYRYCSKKTFHLGDPYFGMPHHVTHTCFTDIVTSGPDSEWPAVLQSMLMALQVARRRIRITNPYLIPNDQLMTALQIAALAGKQVEILIPARGDSFFVQHATYSFLKPLMEAGVVIYFYEQGFIHAKTMVIDDNLAWVGSANLDNRSFFLNFEIACLLYDKDLAQQLNDTFEDDLKYATLVSGERFYNRTIWKRFIDGCCRLLAPLL
ncbi:cardiolipin synthase [Chitinophaga costaii]|uniref:Cardiolipin synthase n=1 Tax=Chitinophaga costaii TaxID=1335309 RepID=A0A1C4AHI1_9BACT|nr:cardiolipin synthase [Chitinophaga costaii]SCB94055.1 cardiolipin synthase [Chitinophaga costaii]